MVPVFQNWLGMIEKTGVLTHRIPNFFELNDRYGLKTGVDRAKALLDKGLKDLWALHISTQKRLHYNDPLSANDDRSDRLGRLYYVGYMYKLFQL